MDDTERKPLERDKKGARILKHNRGGYSRGCRCPACSTDHKVYVDELRRAARVDVWMTEAQVRRIPKTVKLSELDVALIDEIRPEDVPIGQWLRVVAMEKVAQVAGIPLEELDTARRAAPRRRNKSERQPQRRKRGAAGSPAARL
jgi:hypothetical protein